MSPMPTPEYEEHLGHLVRKAQREGNHAHLAPADRRSAARSRADLSDPRLLDTPITDPELRRDGSMTEPYYCKDCGRRFFNLGWHAEACGSPNYERMTDYWERLDALRKERQRLETE